MAHIFQHALVNDPNGAGRSISLVSRASLPAARIALYHTPHITRHNIGAFLRSLASSALGQPVAASLVRRLVFCTAKRQGDAHEHVDVRLVLDALIACGPYVEECLLDMTCSAVACVAKHLCSGAMLMLLQQMLVGRRHRQSGVVRECARLAAEAARAVHPLAQGL